MNKTLLLTALVALAALLVAGVAASTLTLAPTFNLALVSWAVCPNGQRLEYRELEPITYTDAEGLHNQQRISLSCLAADGTRAEGKSAATVAALLTLYFLIVFGPLLVAALRWQRGLRRGR